MGSERELAMALAIPVADVARFTRQPEAAPPDLMLRLGTVLIERGRGMVRVGEMLRDAHAD